MTGKVLIIVNKLVKNLAKHSVSVIAADITTITGTSSSQLVCFIPNFLFYCEQVEDANFSLNHPNQYFIESQRVLGGGKDLKRETDAPQRSQESTAARGATAAREAAANASQGLAERLEDLESFLDS